MLKGLFSKSSTKRFGSGFVTLLFLASQLGSALAPFIITKPAYATNPNPPEAKIRICHSTQPNPSQGGGAGPQNNPYTNPEVSISAADGDLGNDNGQGDHYAEHDGPLFVPGTNQDYWGDIIPPILGVHSGRNWTTAGQAIWNNNCETTRVEVRKVLNPVDDPGLFNLKIEGVVHAANVGHGGTTGEVYVDESENITVNETQGTGTSINNYTTSIVCKNDNGNGDIVKSGDATSVTIDKSKIQKGDDIVCIITNTRKPVNNGSITIKKVAVPMHERDFSFTTTGSGLSDFTLDDDNGADATYQNTKTFSGLAPGVYTVTETEVNGWGLTSIVCDKGEQDGVTKNGATVTFNLPAGLNVTCTYTNTHKRGSLQVLKYVDERDGKGYQAVGAESPFKWSVDSQEVYRDMGITQGNVNVGNRLITEKILDDNYELAGWFVGEGNCTNTDNSKLNPATVNIQEDQISTLTFCNKAKQSKGWLVVVKQLYPRDDDGLFNLNIDGDVKAEGIGNGNTGFVKVNTGNHEVSESAYGETNLEDYDTFYGCLGHHYLKFGMGTVIENVLVKENKVTVCTFVNKKLPRITVQKQAYPYNDPQTFEFKLEKFSQHSIFDWGANVSEHFTLDDNYDSTYSNTSESFRLKPGKYKISEKDVKGWDLADIYCGEHRVYRPKYKDHVIVEVGYGDDVTCTFYNEKRGKVVVTKFNDYNQNGYQDENEPVLSDWDMNLKSHQECYVEQVEFLGLQYENNQNDYNENGCEDWSKYQYDETKKTGEDGNQEGVTTFKKVKPYKDYLLSEKLKDEWHWSNTYCEYPEHEEQEYDERGYPIAENQYKLSVLPGETLHCFVGNYQDPGLNIAKSNNRPNVTTTGDVVTYTLVVSVPSNKGVSYNTTVQDLPPENFEYVSGSWTASSTNGDHNVSGDVASAVGGQPSYASPGQWFLGTLLPGEVVTLTYQARILSNVTSGIYPDLAFALGNSATEARVLSNVSTGASTPFVGTQVAVDVPQAAVLANTGTRDILINMLIGVSLMMVAITTIARRQKKGATV